jgi:trk system potassium uptake protein TrkH
MTLPAKAAADASGRAIGDSEIVSVGVFVFLYFAAFAIGAVILSASGLDTITSLSGVAQALGNVGPGLGPTIGPAGNFASLTDFELGVLSLSMVIGRLEIISILVLLSPSFYR